MARMKVLAGRRCADSTRPYAAATRDRWAIQRRFRWATWASDWAMIEGRDWASGAVGWSVRRILHGPITPTSSRSRGRRRTADCIAEASARPCPSTFGTACLISAGTLPFARGDSWQAVAFTSRLVDLGWVASRLIRCKNACLGCLIGHVKTAVHWQSYVTERRPPTCLARSVGVTIAPARRLWA